MRKQTRVTLPTRDPPRCNHRILDPDLGICAGAGPEGPGPGPRIQASNSGGQPHWSHDGRQIFYIQPDRKLMAVSFDRQKKSASVPRVVFQTRIVTTGFDGWQYDLAPDGRFIINSLPSEHSSPLALLTGWDALLKGR